jgi:hypothetical protein
MLGKNNAEQQVIVVAIDKVIGAPAAINAARAGGNVQVRPVACSRIVPFAA